MLGPEVIAELGKDELESAVARLIPNGFVAGSDPATANQLQIHRCVRARAAALEFESPPTISQFNLHEPARQLSERLSTRVAVWDSWPSIYLVEYLRGVETSKLDSEHNGSWRGVDWHAISTGASPPFAEALVALLRARDHDRFGVALIDDAYGARSHSSEPIAMYHHAYVVAEAPNDLLPLFHAVASRARADSRATVRGLGTFIDNSEPTFGWRAASELTSFLNGGELTIDLEQWLAEPERSAALAALRGALTRLAVGVDVVVPEVVCFHLTEYPRYEGSNPRTGTPVVVEAKRMCGILLGG